MNVRGRHACRPHQALPVVVLLGQRGQNPGDPDSVGSHRHGPALPVLVEDGKAEGLCILAAKLEYVPDLDSPGDLQGARAVGRLVPGAHLGRLD